MAKIVLQRGKEKKIQNFYPNVFQDEIKEKIGTMKTGDLVDIVTEVCSKSLCDRRKFCLCKSSQYKG